jgi:hypothetical protein
MRDLRLALTYNQLENEEQVVFKIDGKTSFGREFEK